MKNPLPQLPSGIGYGYLFAFLNAIVFQIATGTPLVLYAKSLGATSTVLGIIAALFPLFAFLQLPAAGFLPRYGYRRFMIAGWGMRTVMIFVMAGVPLLTFTDQATKISLVLFALFIFSILRGISSGAWMPWITEIIPENRRGHYLSREQLCVHGGSLLALAVSAWTLSFLPDPWRFFAIFTLSGCAGIVSLSALRRVPDAVPSETTRSSGEPVPWKAMLRYRPFWNLLTFNMMWAVVAGSLPVFSVAFTRGVLGFSDSKVLGISLFGFLGALLTLPISARFLDLVGSKKILRAMTLLAAITALGWAILAANIFPHGKIYIVCGLNFFLGMAGANFAVANSRLAMSVMPVMGRNHFFALFTVFASLATGIAPIFSGIALDALNDFRLGIASVTLDRYALYFLASSIILIAACIRVSILEEGKLTKLSRRDYAILGNLRRLGRILQRQS